MGGRLRALVWLPLLLAVAAVAAAGSARAEDEPPGPIVLAAADKKALVELSKQFLMTAVVRRNLDVSYDLVTERMKGGRTRAEWRKGDIPVVPMPPRGSLARVWIYRQTAPGRVYLVFILTPPSGAAGLHTFDLDAVKVGKRWLVNFWTLHMGWPPVPQGGRMRIPFLETHDLGGRWIPPELRTLPPDGPTLPQ